MLMEQQSDCWHWSLASAKETLAADNCRGKSWVWCSCTSHPMSAEKRQNKSTGTGKWLTPDCAVDWQNSPNLIVPLIQTSEHSKYKRVSQEAVPCPGWLLRIVAWEIWWKDQCQRSEIENCTIKRLRERKVCLYVCMCKLQSSST